LIDHAALLQGKTILNYFADNGATTTTDVAAFTKTLIDDNWQDYINSLKFQFQTYKYMLDEATNKGNPFTQNHFNFRKNSTLNSLAKDQRDVISEAKDFNCNKPPVDESQNNQSEWPYLFQENGIGQAYLNAVAFKNPSQIFCNDAQKL
jgi:hypothetical protein